MKVSYFNRRTGKKIPSQAPVEMICQQALGVFRSLHAGSFFALELSPPHVLQFLNEKGAWYTELLNTETRTAVGCTLSWPMAEQALEAAFQGQSVVKFLAEHYEWVCWEPVDTTKGEQAE